MSLCLGNSLGTAELRAPQQTFLLNVPLCLSVLSFIGLLLAAIIGSVVRGKTHSLSVDEHDDFGVVLNATLTLLALLIGFSFSMAISRYDQRKDYEEAEANAIGTEYVRADLLPAGDSARVRQLLRKYLEQRVMFYTTADRSQLAKINADTATLQNELWAALLPEAAAHPTMMVALVVSGMNDVLNSQGFTQAAWWNRIPVAAWGMMAAVAVCCNFLIGYGAHAKGWRTLLILPAIVSIAFFLISDIDSPRGGAIQVAPYNLTSLLDSIAGQ